MERFDRIFTNVCDHIATYVCGVIVVIMTLYVCVHVFSRYVLGIGGIIGTYSFVGALVVPFVYLGLSYAWYKRGYVIVDILQVRIKGRVLWGFQFVFLLLTLFLFVALFYGAFKGTIHSYAAGTTVGQLPVLTPKWVWEATILIGTFLMFSRNILDLIRMVRTGEVISADR